jgi:hypothetical protein
MIVRHWIASGSLTIVLLACPANGSAYDVRTHGEITRAAFERSQRVADYLTAVGLKSTDTFALGEVTTSRLLADFENTGTARDWMIEGAIREDDLKSHPGLDTLGCEFPEHVPSPIDRSLNHFFDVQRGGRGLTVLGVTLGVPAPDWALGRQGRGPDPDQNQFSLPDARDYQLRSLIAAARDERGRNTALLFRALGQVVHLLEDSAAPQHTRNDPHAGCVEVITGEHSWFEKYVETRALKSPFRRHGEFSLPLIVEGYEIVATLPYPDFFATASRQGLADLSSRNFLSVGTNFSLVFNTCGGLPEPVCEPDAYGQEPRSFSIRTIDGALVEGTVTVYTRDVVDLMAGTSIPRVPVSSRSVWDQHLEQRGLFPIFTMNTINYDAAADILLPRAAGYAAGLLDAFFRGRLEAGISVTPNGNGYLATLQLTNRTPGETMTGTFTVYADDQDGVRTELPGARWNLTLPPDTSTSQLTFVVPGTTSPGPWIVAFQGTLGTEAGVIVAAQSSAVYVGRLARDYFYSERTWSNPPLVYEDDQDPPFEDLTFFWTRTPSVAAWETVTRWRLDFLEYSSFGPERTDYAVRAEDSFMVFYTPPGGAISRVLELSAGAGGGCYERSRLEFSVYYYRQFGWETSAPVSSAAAEIVELEPPPDLATLFGYSHAAPPRVLGTLGRISTEQAGPTLIDLGEARFFGVRLLTRPGDPGPLLPPAPYYPSGDSYYSVTVSCAVSATPRFR